MKNKRFIIATLLVVVATTVAIVSCKKEDQEALQSVSQPVKTFTVPQIDDMNAYLKGFKQKMKESQNAKEAEYLSLEEAAWHLSSVANYDYANANVEYGDLRFDTINTHLTVTNNAVLLHDLNTAYAALSSAINSYIQSNTLDNANIRFVNVTVSDSGEVTAVLTVTFDWGHTWYYEDVFDAMLHCLDYFSDDSTYYASGLGASELQRVLNLIESHQLFHLYSRRVYYTLSREVTFNYDENIDPYGSPSFLNSRLFASSTALDPDITDFMCLYLDSYLGLGFDNILPTEVIADWKVTYGLGYNYTYTQQQISFHKLIVRYAIPHYLDPSDPGINN